MNNHITNMKDQEVRMQLLIKSSKKQWDPNKIEERVQVLYLVHKMHLEMLEVLNQIQQQDNLFLLHKHKMVVTIEMKIYYVLFWLC